MKLSTTLATTLLSTGTLTQAQFTNQSSSFYLELLTDDATYNGTFLSACHEGAAIEGLCAFGDSMPNATITSDIFQLNSSIYSSGGSGVSGELTYELRGGNFNLSEPLAYSINPASNVASLFFYPGTTGDSVYIAFDADGLMNIQSSLDDTTVPASDNGTISYYRFYVCTTNNIGYTYPTLNWVFGDGAPQNPTCCPTNVTRIFV
ncbi:hypothetical protein LTR62_008662 [Meristemomyces frigidus]|uniref:DUF7907 domain-containing protein n=1 Tax=Meristemomyces frigidus TaxID=1508187 RepID=A0AAN7THX3_9PEZI|nr:hypothetical protein LTR62_008662 [Meristemomyces frigidus]